MSEHAPTGESSSSRTVNAWRSIGWCCIILVAFAWRLLGITSNEVWRDEAITIIHTHAGWSDMLLRLPWVEDTPPLIFLLFKAWSLISQQECFLRLLPVLTGTAWVYVAMLTARLIHPRAWWTAGMIAAFSPLSVHFSQEIRGYSLLTLWTACCLWAVQKMVCASGESRSVRHWAFATAGFGILSAHTHASGVFVFPAAMGYAIARTVRTNWGHVLRPSALLTWLIGILPILWFARHWTAIHVAEGDWWVSPPTLDTARYIAERFLGMTALTDFSLAHQSRWGLWLGFGLERVVMVSVAGLVAMGIVGTGSQSVSNSSSLRRAVLALNLASFAFVGLLFLAGRVSLPGILDRTLLPAWTPMVIMLGICGADACRGRMRTVRVGMVVCLTMVWAATWTWVVTAGPPRRPESARLFAWMRQRLSPNDLIFTWPRWYKDQTVYGLADAISADQLLDEYETYAGKPPRHRLEPPRVDITGWQARFAARINAHFDRFGTGFGIWVVRYATTSPTPPQSPEMLIIRRCREIGRMEFMSDKAMSIVCFQPLEPWPESQR